MSRASDDDVPSVGEGNLPQTESRIIARRRALKAMLGSAPVVLTFPSITSAASSSSCQMNLDNVTPRPEPISDTNMTTPAWFRLLVVEQTYEPGGILYLYQSGTTTWYYQPPNYTRTDTLPMGFDPIYLKSKRLVYVLADISKDPYEPDFDGGGTYSTWSCMMSMPGTPA